MEFRDLHYLEILAEELHFGRAAARLNMTQPALSQALARLEKEIGFPLLQRDHRAASLTSAGSVLLAESQSVLKCMTMACELARRAGRGDTGSVTIGFLDAAMFDILPTLLREFRTRYPAVHVTSRQLSASELIHGVEVGQLDLALCRREALRPGVEYRTLRRERLSVAVSKNNPLARAKDVTLADLYDQDFIIPAAEGVPSLHSVWLGIWYAASFTPRIVAYISSIQVLIELVAQEIGVAFVVESWAASNENVVVKELRDVDVSLEIAVAYRPEQISSVASNFLRMALQNCVPEDSAHLAPGGQVGD
jgi:DNA-binding transcriptional LysR family regulator